MQGVELYDSTSVPVYCILAYPRARTKAGALLLLATCFLRASLAGHQWKLISLTQAAQLDRSAP